MLDSYCFGSKKTEACLWSSYKFFSSLNAEDSLYVYFSTLSRMPAWLIGIVFGYFLYRNKNKKNSISQLANITLWLVSLCSMLALVLYQVVFVRHNYDVTRSAFFNSLSRPIWCLAVSSIIYSCSTGRGGKNPHFCHLILCFFQVVSTLFFPIRCLSFWENSPTPCTWFTFWSFLS
jgi:ABC-type proline/glycine betaine transport system permease subunit